MKKNILSVLLLISLIVSSCNNESASPGSAAEEAGADSSVNSAADEKAAADYPVAIDSAMAPPETGEPGDQRLRPIQKKTDTANRKTLVPR